MKKLILSTIFSFVIGSFLMAQIGTETVTTSTFTGGTLPAVGVNFDVPINVTGFPTDNWTLIIYLDYNHDIIEYTGTFTDPESLGSWLTVTPMPSNVLRIQVADPGFSGQFTVDGLLTNLEFTFLGGYTDLDLVSQADNPAEYCSYMNAGFEEYAIPNLTDGAVDGSYYATTIDGGVWSTATDWSTGVVPNTWANVTVASGTETTTSADATANDVTIENGGQLTLNSGNTLTVGGDFLVESASGNGSFIDMNTAGGLVVTGTKTVENYLTTGNYHGISMPVIGQTAHAFETMGTVYLKYYNEATDDYTNITSYDEVLNTMQGYMIKIASGGPYTASYSGNFNTGTVSYTTEYTAGFGYNFVGNPFTSTIDWNAGSGWTKTGVGVSTWVYNDGNWATWNGTTGVNGGTRYIAMNQGFFVQASSAGTLAMTNGVCTHTATNFLKGQASSGDMVRLQVEDNGLTDESVVLFIDGATVGYDDNFDSHKLFSFNPEYPQLYATANEFMAINALPTDYRESISMDVKGADGNSLTISVTEAIDFDNLYLKDEFTGMVTNLKLEDYSFTYDADITNRFNLFFSITDVTELNADEIRIFAYDQVIQVNLDIVGKANIAVYNLLGQEIVSMSASGQTQIPVYNTGYYVVKVTTDSGTSSQKVFIK